MPSATANSAVSSCTVAMFLLGLNLGLTILLSAIAIRHSPDAESSPVNSLNQGMPNSAFAELEPNSSRRTSLNSGKGFISIESREALRLGRNHTPDVSASTQSYPCFTTATNISRSFFLPLDFSLGVFPSFSCIILFLGCRLSRLRSMKPKLHVELGAARFITCTCTRVGERRCAR